MTAWILAALIAALPPGAIQIHSSDLVWRDAPATLPAGTRVAVLEGSPQALGSFTIRLRVPAGASLGKHTHPRDERVTVLSGLVEVDLGTPHGKQRFGAGDFYLNPPGLPHAITFVEDSVIQITGVGPWVVEMAKAEE